MEPREPLRVRSPGGGERPAEIVLLGCTELPLIQAMDEDFRVGDQRVVLLDPTTILAQRCVALVR